MEGKGGDRSQTGPLQELGAGLRPQGAPRLPTPQGALSTGPVLGPVHPTPTPSSPQEPKRPSSQLPSPSSQLPSEAQLTPIQPGTPKPQGPPLELPPGKVSPASAQLADAFFGKGVGPWDPPDNLAEAHKPEQSSLVPGHLEQVNGQVAPEPPHLSIKQEPREEPCALGTQAVKREANGEPIGAPGTSNHLLLAGPRSEAGHLLLQKLLRAKNVQLSTGQGPEGLRAEIDLLLHFSSNATIWA